MTLPALVIALIGIATLGVAYANWRFGFRILCALVGREKASRVQRLQIGGTHGGTVVLAVFGVGIVITALLQALK